MAEAEDMEKDEEDLILDVCKAFGKLNNWRAHQLAEEEKYPLLSEVVFGSGCGQSYLASNIMLSPTRMEQETGISVKAHCFTEPHARKNMCKRMTAVLKTHVRAYLNQGNNVETPAEVYKALTHNGGNISLLRNFTLEQDRIISYKAYGMGSGQVTKLSEVKVPKIIQLKIAHDFNNIVVSRLEQVPLATRRTAQATSSQEDSEEESLYHNCSECDKSFRRYRDLLVHEVSGKHTSAKLSPLPLRDHLLECYQERYTTAQFTLQENCNCVLKDMATEKPTTSEMLDKQSWALQRVVPHTRYTEEVRAFLQDQQKRGSGKADPNKKKERVDQPIDEDEVEACAEEDRERAELQGRDLVLSHLSELISPANPVVYNGRILCEVSATKWTKMSKSKLTEVANYLNIPIKTKSTIPILRMAIKDKLAICTCQSASGQSVSGHSSRSTTYFLLEAMRNN
uniref:C2H2-type domain-containing protein n=1 Tax=Plectus sambesii TaxID=2011161 RepID=A0A914XKY9_9BILA